MPKQGAALKNIFEKRSVFFLGGTFAGAAVLCVVGAMGVACGSIDCSETATCADQGSDATDDGQDGTSLVADSPSDSEGGGEEQGAVDAGPDQTADTTTDTARDVAAEAAADVTAPDVTAADVIDETASDASLDGVVSDAQDAADGGPGACTCVPAPPSGWVGPVAVFEQSSDAGAPPCPSTYPTLAFSASSNPSVPSASCQCTCEGPCTLQVSTYTNNNCGSSHLCATTAVSKSCVAGAGACAVQTAKITTGVGFTGCDGGATKAISSFGWGTAAGACVNGAATYVQGSCPPGQICAEAPPSTFARGLCVYQPGSAACPDAGYAIAHTYYGDASDSRDCDASACQCTGPATSTCSVANVTISSAADCSGGAALTGSCGTPFPVTSSPYIGASITSSAGSCIQSGTASPVGTVTPNAPTTVCCAN